MKLINILVPERLLKELDDLVELKLYPTRSEAIRMAIRDLIINEHPKYKRFKHVGQRAKRRG